MKNISNISFNKIHYYADLQFNILYYNIITNHLCVRI